MTRTTTAFSLAVLALAVAGCAPAPMVGPSDLAEVAPMPVEGRSGWRASQRASFGPYEATDVDRSWTRGSGWSIGIGPIGGGSNQGRQEYAFRFLEDGSELERIGCLAVGSRGTGRSRVVDVDLSAREALECRPVAPAAASTAEAAAEPAWDLVLEAGRDRHLAGFLRVGEERYDVVATGRGGGIGPAQSFGFEFREGDRAIAAVETVNEGTVLISPEVTGALRAAIAGAAAALLLYERVETGG